MATKINQAQQYKPAYVSCPIKRTHRQPKQQVKTPRINIILAFLIYAGFIYVISEMVLRIARA